MILGPCHEKYHLKVHTAREEFCLITSELPASQINGHMTIEMSVLSGPHIGYYTGVPD